MLLLSVFDKEAKTYELCFTKTTTAEATREFIIACRNPNIMYNQFPEQFELHQLAEITSQGEIINQEKLVVITAENVMAMEKVDKLNSELPTSLQNSAS